MLSLSRHSTNITRQVLRMACLSVLLCVTTAAQSQQSRRNQVEFGLQGGLSYYVGDANPQLFQHVREAYGAELSYLFNRRWSLQLQGTSGRWAGLSPTEQGLPDPKGEIWNNQYVSLDVMARFNFLPFGETSRFNNKIKPYTPYIFLGVGVSMHQHFSKVTPYIPVGVGFRWLCSEHVGMYLAWQHNICLMDNIEPFDSYNDNHKLNGSNIMNFDLTSTLQFGIVFEFAREKKVCKFCKEPE